MPTLGATQQAPLGSVRVYAVEFPVTGPDESAERIKDPGMRFGIVDMKLCATSTTTD